LQALHGLAGQVLQFEGVADLLVEVFQLTPISL